MIREGFRQLLINDGFKFEKVILGSTVLTMISTVDPSERSQLLSSLKLVVLGAIDPISFLWQIHEKFQKAIEIERKRNHRSF